MSVGDTGGGQGLPVVFVVLEIAASMRECQEKLNECSGFFNGRLCYDACTVDRSSLVGISQSHNSDLNSLY